MDISNIFPCTHPDTRSDSSYFSSELRFARCLIRVKDPIFGLATPLQPGEMDSSTREVIAAPCGQEDSLSGPRQEAEETAAVQGGWFGRGYGKGRKKKKA